MMKSNRKSFYAWAVTFFLAILLSLSFGCDDVTTRQLAEEEALKKQLWQEKVDTMYFARNFRMEKSDRFFSILVILHSGSDPEMGLSITMEKPDVFEDDMLYCWMGDSARSKLEAFNNFLDSEGVDLANYGLPPWISPEVFLDNFEVVRLLAEETGFWQSTYADY
jgi:hypothetical protein